MPACIKSIACAFAVLILVGFMLADPVAAGEAEMLNGDAFMAKIGGNTLVGENDSGVSYQVFYGADGTMKGYSEKGDWAGFNEGAWEADGKMLCFQWSSWRDRERYCRTFSSKDGKILSYDDSGDLTGTSEHEKGNSRGL